MSEKLESIIDTHLDGEDPLEWVDNRSWLWSWLRFEPEQYPAGDHHFQRFQGHNLQVRNRQLLASAVFSVEDVVDPEGRGPGPVYYFPGFVEQVGRLPTPDDVAIFRFLHHRVKVRQEGPTFYEGAYRLQIIDPTPDD